jgi:hypothetical protein
MKKRIAAAVWGAFALGSSLAVAVVPSAAAAGSGAPAPLDPEAAAALVSAAPALAAGSTLRSVTAVEALAAATIPGALVWTAPQLTLQQATGAVAAQPAATVRTTAAAIARTTAAASTRCWANAAWRQWGTWPYEQKIIDTTYWCAVYGSRITYRSSSTTGSGTLCGVSWRSSQLVGGGTGYPWFTIRASAGFSCPTAIPWIVLHPSHHEDTTRTDTGGTFAAGSG